MFYAALNRIEVYYLDYFTRVCYCCGYEHNQRLSSHYSIEGTDGTIEFSINKDSKLPSFIRTECEIAYNRYLEQSKNKEL